MRLAVGSRSRCWACVLVFVHTLIVVVGLMGDPSSAFAQTGSEHQEHPLPDATKPETTIRAFGAVQWGATQLRDIPNSFTLGQLALFVTSNLSDRVSVLAEVVAEGGISTAVDIDLERLLITFRFNDYFNLSAGRYHTGIGFYNAAFHHGTYFETPIGRPRAFKFEDEGGPLPIHEVGVTARGVVPHTGSSLRYVAEIGNGRLWKPAAGDETANTRDENNAKSTNVGLSYRPDQWRGFEVGASYYHDTIFQTPTSAVDHRIGAIYAVYRTPSAELMAEWLSLVHVTEDRSSYHNDGGYVQASRAWGTLRPYYRYDRLAINPATPFVGVIGSYKANIVGLRFDPEPWVGFKTQYERSDELGQRGVNAIRTQLVFVF